MLAIWFSALISDQLLDICDRPSAVSCDSMMWRFTFTFKIVWKSTDTISVLFQTLLPATSRLIAHNMWQRLKVKSKDILDVIHFVCIGSQLNRLPGSMMPPLGRTKMIINWEKDPHPNSHLVAVSSAEQLVRFNGHPPTHRVWRTVKLLFSFYQHIICLAKEEHTIVTSIHSVEQSDQISNCPAILRTQITRSSDDQIAGANSYAQWWVLGRWWVEVDRLEGARSTPQQGPLCSIHCPLCTVYSALCTLNFASTTQQGILHCAQPAL